MSTAFPLSCAACAATQACLVTWHEHTCVAAHSTQLGGNTVHHYSAYALSQGVWGRTARREPEASHEQGGGKMPPAISQLLLLSITTALVLGVYHAHIGVIFLCKWPCNCKMKSEV